MVNPSWAATKLTQAQALRPRWLKQSPDAERHGARALADTSPRQKSRTVSRNLSFHSAQPGGKPPT